MKAYRFCLFTTIQDQVLFVNSFVLVIFISVILCCFSPQTNAFADEATMCNGYSLEMYRQEYEKQYRDAHDGSEPADDTELCNALFGSAWNEAAPGFTPTPNDLNKDIDAVKSPEEFN
jgi:hypothetical protein